MDTVKETLTDLFLNPPQPLAGGAPTGKVYVGKSTFDLAGNGVLQAGSKISYTQSTAANTTSGVFTCNGTTNVVITTSAAAITNLVVISLNTVGGTVGAIPKVTTITAGTSFTVAGTASDTSVYNWAIIGTI